MMNTRSTGRTDKRVPVALGVLALVLTLLGSQHVSRDRVGPESGQSGQVTFAAASSALR